MATTAPMSTNSSKGDYSGEAGRNTSTLAGDATAKRSFELTTKPSSSQMNLKDSTELESSSDSNTSVTSTSSVYAKKKRKKSKKKPTENHLKIRTAVDAGDKWEFDLEREHGLTDEQACVCVSIVGQNLQEDEFPPSKGDRIVELAKEGWEHLREVDRLTKLYPECGDQTNIDGEW
eukprot:CAMPEP_0202443344 /NCGR_PEP_ID=MMETSP1360-20130828/2647_1 /ASSEMBLY_ACC=CAM_ASM_000848 /TAXON_ID=515479 /ORGANISM="Licmophora paradoxa, Strain CCMP2313" /LENGTH=175 /DNA_ID=CAMNT_0049059017 /DNA_START=163 /DNA_END=687 /DNA_ORIENTATION=-